LADWTCSINKCANPLDGKALHPLPWSQCKIYRPGSICSMQNMANFVGHANVSQSSSGWLRGIPRLAWPSVGGSFAGPSSLSSLVELEIPSRDIPCAHKYG
jgi:hypothetical protein